MSTHQLTAFQKAAEEEILALPELKRSVVQREVLFGVIPVYAKEPQTVVHIVADGLQVWLWSDEAHLHHGGTECRFERPDFGSIEQLRGALLNEIRARLAESL